MPKRGTTNLNLKELIKELKKTNKPFYKKIAYELEKPSRQRAAVNLEKIEKYTKNGETIVVPGKVLGVGSLSHKITIAALQFSDSVKKEKNAKLITIKELIKMYPEGSGIKIIK